MLSQQKRPAGICSARIEMFQYAAWGGWGVAGRGGTGIGMEGVGLEAGAQGRSPTSAAGRHGRPPALPLVDGVLPAGAARGALGGSGRAGPGRVCDRGRRATATRREEVEVSQQPGFELTRRADAESRAAARAVFVVTCS